MKLTKVTHHKDGKFSIDLAPDPQVRLDALTNNGIDPNDPDADKKYQDLYTEQMKKLVAMFGGEEK